MKKTDKRIITVVILLVMAMLLPACQNKWIGISRSKGKAAGGVDTAWSELAKEYPLLANMKPIMDPVDFYKPVGSGIRFGFLEVKDPEAKYLEIKAGLEADGFAQDTEYDGFMSNRNRGNDVDKEEATSVRFIKELDYKTAGFDKIIVTIEYFPLKFKNSRNVFIWITK